MNGEKNFYFEKTLEGVPEDIKKELLDAVYFFGKPNQPSLNINDETKSERLRKTFNILNNFLIENKINQLNTNQKLFLCTGALCDKIFFPDKEIELLEKEIYEKLLKMMEDISNLSYLSEQIYFVLDKFQALARKDLEPLDLEKPLHQKKTKQIEDNEMLLRKKDEILRQINEIFPLLERNFSNYLELIKKVDTTIIFLKNIRSYFESFSSTIKEEQSKIQLQEKILNSSQNIFNFFSTQEDLSHQIKDQVNKIIPKISEVFEINLKLKEINSATKSFSKKSSWILIDGEKLKNIKKDIQVVTKIIVKGCDSAQNRIPYSASRILLNVHTEKISDPFDAYCTVENLNKAILKISKIHINLFPKQENGFPVIPPIIIEPGRNYVEWFDDRFIISFVSGEYPRKGTNYSFTPVDMQVLKIFGLYLTKDPIFTYRGERNIGTFMGDYAGQIEKKAKVIWTGEEKKFSIGTTTKILDEASRDEAVQDYIEFVFNMANGLSAPPRLGQRRVNVFLNYVMIESLEKTIKLILKHIAFNNPFDARPIILKYANKSTKEAKRLVTQAFSSDPQISKFYEDNLELCLTKIFGKEAITI